MSRGSSTICGFMRADLGELVSDNTSMGVIRVNGRVGGNVYKRASFSGIYGLLGDNFSTIDGISRDVLHTIRFAGLRGGNCR